MRKLVHPSRPAGRLFYCLISVLVAVGVSRGAPPPPTPPATTTISDVIYRADGSTAAGTLLITWPAFNTADNRAVPAGSMSLAIGPFGAVNLALVPNQGATPAGTYYKVVMKLNDGTTSEEFWVVPTLSPTTISAIRSQVVPAGVALQVVTRQYVDQQLATKADGATVVHRSGDESVDGVKEFTSSPTVPTPTTEAAAANKVYVDSAAAAAGSTGGVRYADKYPGSDACTKIAAAIADLPPTGGTVDARGLEGAQTCAAGPFTGVSKPVTLLLGKTTFTCSVGWALPSNLHLIGLGKDKTEVKFSAGAVIDQAVVANGKTDIEIAGVKFSSGGSGVGRMVLFSASSNVSFHDNVVTGATAAPSSGPIAGVEIDNGSTDIWVENNDFTGNGVTPTSSTSNGDIVVWNTAVSRRIHIRHNRIHGSNTTTPLALLDAADSDILGNDVDQNNKFHAAGNNNGYGILLYQGTTNPTHNLVSQNKVRNCASSGIYTANSDYQTISDNIISNVGQQMTDGSLPVAGIALSAGLRPIVTGNQITSSTRDGITLVAPTPGAEISVNTITSPGQYGIKLRGAITDATVSGNTVTTTTNEGIRADTSITRTSITGNIVRTTSRSGIQLVSASDSTIGNNIVSGTADGFYGIQTLAGSGNTYAGNTVTNAQYGMDLSDSSIEVIGNRIGVSLTAVVLDGGTDQRASGNILVGPSSGGFSGAGSTRSVVGPGNIINATTPYGNITTTYGNVVNGVEEVTGAGNVVLSTSPSLTTPNIGAATGTTVDVSTGYRVGGAAAAGNVLRGNGTNFVAAQLAFSDLNGTATAAQGATGQNSSGSTGVARVSSGTWSFDAGIAHLASSTSANLASVLSDETGSGKLMFNDAPVLSSFTVAGLPAAGTADRIAIVSDAATAGSCTSGGGSNRALCRDTGAAWESLGDGGDGGGGGGGANTALSNLASVAANAALIPGADNTLDLGSSSLGWKDLYAKGVAALGPATASFDANSQGYLSATQHSLKSLNSATAGNRANLVSVFQDNNATNNIWGTYSLAEATNTSGTKSSVTGTSSDVYLAGSGGTAGALLGYDTYAQQNSGTTIGGYIAGFRNYIQINSGATATAAAYGLYSQGINLDAAITVPAIAGVRIDSNTTSAGTITNNFGLDIADQTAGATNYAIRTGLGKVSLGDTTSAPIFDATTGYRIGGAAASGNVLRGNGANFVSATLACADVTNCASLVASDTAGVGPSKAGTASSAARSDHDHRSFATLTWYFPGTPSTGVSPMILAIPQGIANGTITGMQVTVGTTSASSSAFNIQRCTSSCSGASPTFANLYSSDNTLGANTSEADFGATNLTTTLNAKDQFKANLVTIGSGLANVTITLTYKYDTTN